MSVYAYTKMITYNWKRLYFIRLKLKIYFNDVWTSFKYVSPNITSGDVHASFHAACNASYRSIRFIRVRDRGENFLHASWAVSKHVHTHPFKYYSDTYARELRHQEGKQKTRVTQHVHVHARVHVQNDASNTKVSSARMYTRYVHVHARVHVQNNASNTWRSRTTEGSYDTASRSNSYLWRRVRSWTMKDSY
jgi:hypothetical protein